MTYEEIRLSKYKIKAKNQYFGVLGRAEHAERMLEDIKDEKDNQ